MGGGQYTRYEPAVIAGVTFAPNTPEVGLASGTIAGTGPAGVGSVPEVTLGGVDMDDRPFVARL